MPERQFVWGLRYIDDLVLRDRDPDNSGTLSERFYALQDANWNVDAIVSAPGTVQERYSYTPYGLPTVLKPDFTIGSGASLYDWETQFAGYRWDSESWLYQVRNRELQPLLGVWITRDPVGFGGGDWNLYRYTWNSPLSAVDPSGLWLWPWDPNASWNPKDTFNLWTGRGSSGIVASSNSGSTGSLLGALKSIIPTGVTIWSGDARLLVVPFLPPAVTFEVIAFFNGDIVSCCRGDGTTGLMAVGSFGLEGSAGIGTSIGGNSGVRVNKPLPRDKYWYYNQKGKRGGAKAPVISRRGLGDPTVTTRRKSGINKSLGRIPPCKTKLDLTFILGLSGFASAGVGRLSAGAAFDFPIGSCSISSGCNWNFAFSGSAVNGLGTGARVQVYGRGELDGQVVLT